MQRFILEDDTIFDRDTLERLTSMEAITDKLNNLNLLLELEMNDDYSE